MADLRNDPKYAAAADAIERGLDPDEVERVVQLSFELGQAVFLSAWEAAREFITPDQVPMLVSSILDSAWARAAAEAERHQVLGERAGMLIGVEERLVCSADAIRRLYYPEWSRLLTAQAPAGGGAQ